MGVGSGKLVARPRASGMGVGIKGTLGYYALRTSSATMADKESISIVPVEVGQGSRPALFSASIVAGQSILLGQGSPAFSDPLWSFIARGRSQPAQVRQDSGKADQLLPKRSISFFRKFDDSHPYDPPLNQPGRVQIQGQNQPSRDIISPLDRAIRHRSYTSFGHCGKRIIDFLILFDTVAASACVGHIRILRGKLREQTLRLKVIKIKFARGLAPLFTLQAICAAKRELVAEPWTI